MSRAIRHKRTVSNLCRTVLHGELWERNILIRVEQECCNNNNDAV